MARVVAVDLGSHTVKIATYKVVRGSVELAERFVQPVPQEGAQPSLEHRLAALDALLDDRPGCRPQSGDVVVLGWPSNQAAFHRLGMPFSDRAQIERTLPFAVENEVPFELDQMVLAWRPAEQRAQTHVMAVLSRQDRVREWIDALNERKIDPASVHVDADLFGPWAHDPPAVAHDADADLPPPPPLVAILDLGHLHTSVSVVRGGVVQYARSINVGGHAFTKAIQEALGCSWEEAELIKHGAQSVSPETGEDLPADQEITADLPTEGGAPRPAASGYGRLDAAARQKVDAAMGLLLAEIRSTLIKAEDVLEGEVAEVRLTGGTSRIAELWDYLATDLGVPVRAATPPKAGKGAFSPAHALTHALALSTLGGPGVPADLRVGGLAFRGGTDWLRSALGYGIGAAAFFGVAATLMFALNYRSLVLEQREAEAAVRELVRNAFPATPDSLLETMDQARAVMAQNTEDAVTRAAILGTSGGVPPTTDLLYQLTMAFPPHPDVVVELTDLTIGAEVISFNAEAPGGYASSSAIEAKLKENPRFKGAVKGQETRLASGAVKFPITIPLGDAADAKTDDGEG